MQTAVEFAIPHIEEHLPENLINKLKLPTLKEAIKFVHLPPNNADIKLLNEKTSDFHKRIIFDELFFLQLGILLIKQNRICEKGISFNPEGDLLKNSLKIFLLN